MKAYLQAQDIVTKTFTDAFTVYMLAGAAERTRLTPAVRSKLAAVCSHVDQMQVLVQATRTAIDRCCAEQRRVLPSDVHMVEKIVARREVQNGQVEYEVKWLHE